MIACPACNKLCPLHSVVAGELCDRCMDPTQQPLSSTYATGQAAIASPVRCLFPTATTTATLVLLEDAPIFHDYAPLILCSWAVRLHRNHRSHKKSRCSQCFFCFLFGVLLSENPQLLRTNT